MKCITLIVGLLVVGCGKQEQATTEKPVKELTAEEKKIVGTYEYEFTGTIAKQRLVFQENGKVERGRSYGEDAEGKWSVVDGEIHIEWGNGESFLGPLWLMRVNTDTSITLIAHIQDGKRIAHGRERTHKKIKLIEEKQKALRDSAVGTYEAKKDGDTYKLVFLENGIWEGYVNGKKKKGDYKWSISKDGELHIVGKDGDIGVYRINKDGNITGIADIEDGKREDLPKDKQDTLKKIK